MTSSDCEGGRSGHDPGLGRRSAAPEGGSGRPAAGGPRANRRRCLAKLNASARYWLAASLFVLVFSLLAALSSARLGNRLTRVDHVLLVSIANARTPALTDVCRAVSGLASALPIQILWVAMLAVLVFFRRWRHLAVAIVAMALTNAVT